MREELIFEAEPFVGYSEFDELELESEGASQYESEMESAPFAFNFETDEAEGYEGEWGYETGGSTVSAATTKLPSGLLLLPHVHDPKSLPSGAASGVPQAMTPAGMNPGFVDPATDALIVNTAPNGLHTRLQALVAAAPYKQHASKISIALVDLTGPRLFAPDFAGYRSTAPVNGASLPKICALYPAHQLRFELQVLAEQLKLTTKTALVEAMRKKWDAAKLERKQQPNLEEMFEYTEAPPQTVAVKPSAKLDQLIKCVYEKNCNYSASLLIDRVGLPYIGSVLWQSGLFHTRRSGLWLRSIYGASCDSKKCRDAGCCPANSKIEKPLKPVYATPAAATTHNATALSAVTYFTLMAQGRLANDAVSARVQKDLEQACSWLWQGQLNCTRMTPPSKCGIYAGFIHDVILIERNVGPSCGGKVIRYAAALMTSQVGLTSLFKQFLTDADALIQQNNP